MPEEGKGGESEGLCLIKELVGTGVLREPIWHVVQTALSLGPASPDEAVAVCVSVTDTCVTSSLEHKDVATRHWHPRTVVSFAQTLECGSIWWLQSDEARSEDGTQEESCNFTYRFFFFFFFCFDSTFSI